MSASVMRVVRAVLAGLVAVLGYAGAEGLVGGRLLGILAITVAAVQAGLVAYDHGLQTPAPAEPAPNALSGRTDTLTLR